MNKYDLLFGLSHLFFFFSIPGTGQGLVTDSPALLMAPDMENKIQDTAFSTSNPDAIVDLLVRILRCLASIFSPGLPEYTNVLQRLWNTLLQCLKASSGAMQAAVGSCLLCVGDEVSEIPDGRLSGNAIEAALLRMGQLQMQTPPPPTAKYLGRLADLARERKLPQLEQRLREQIELIGSGLLLMM